MKVLYTLFNLLDPEDTSVFYSEENAKTTCAFLNSPWKDEDGTIHKEENTFVVGTETFRDEEWPIVLRTLAIVGETLEKEEDYMKTIKEFAHDKEQRLTAGDGGETITTK